MADRLEESVSIIRRDRDRSRDFLADVSHELRTPIAATRTFIELLQGPAGEDTAARTEFLDSSAVQLDRLDWLAQNLLELSKLDSGLVLLELRPDDIRGTIESAVEQQLAAAERKGITLTATLPDRPIRIHHDAPRVGQVVTNLVGNALKFTRRGGEVRVTARQDASGGARASRSPTPASASTRPSCRGSSSASTAAPRPTRRGAPAPAWVSPSSSRSWTCTTVRSRWRAGWGTGRASSSRCRATRARPPARRPPGANPAGRWTILHLLAPRRSTPHPQPRVHPPVGRMPIRPPPPGETTRPMNDNPTEMNDQPTGNPGEDPGDRAIAAGGVDALDDTQPIDVERFAPTPDPRPDDRWAWAAPSATPPPDRWYEPAPSEPGPAGPGLHARARSPRAAPTRHRGGVPPRPSRHPSPRRTPRRRRRRSAGAERASARSSPYRSCPRSSRPAARC